MNSLLIITHPFSFANEVEHINALFDTGLEILHLRKPDMTKEEYEQFLSSISPKYHKRIMLHDFFELAEKYNVRGVHLNRRNPVYNGTKNIKTSQSCHSIPELKTANRHDYVFLSPVFNSISKAGYMASFSGKELLEASGVGLINEKVIALGGIDTNTLPLLKPYKFGGVAVLGAIWSISPEADPEKIIERFLAIRQHLEQ